MRFVCAGCGLEASAIRTTAGGGAAVEASGAGVEARGVGVGAPDVRWPFRCERAGSGDDIDHVLVPRRERSLPSGGGGGTRSSHDAEPHPFLRYRDRLAVHAAALAVGVDDEAYRAATERLDRAVADVDGRGFHVTPCGRDDALSRALGFASEGGVWVKDETGNVSGSHKARHLFGIALLLDLVDGPAVAARRGAAASDGAAAAPLAIASCGNAALAAAIVARAAGRRLTVFVPPSANPRVIERLRALGCAIEVCPRVPGETGDPCYLRFREAVARGALPFCCQGPDNGLTIDGGKTLGYELAEQAGAVDRVFVQAGGGALASACAEALRELAADGTLASLPRIHVVQSAGAYPLARAYDRLVARIVPRLAAHRPAGVAARAELCRGVAARAVVAEELQFAAEHRSQFMWPWEEEPRSVAHGILDDETYDWRAVLEAMLASGGYPIVVDEATLEEANRVARATTGIDVDATGSAGLAGLLALSRSGGVAPTERAALIFSGVRR